MYTSFVSLNKYSNYAPISHTSGATQVPSGMVALLKEYFGKNFGPQEFKKFINTYSIDLGEIGFDYDTGYGLLALPKQLPERSLYMKDYFKDDNGAWHEKFNNRLAEKGIIQGYEDGTVKADQQITRGEVNKIVSEAIDFILEEVKEMINEKK